MAGKIDSRLIEKNIEIPEAASPVANYLPYVKAGNLVFVSGQITLENGTLRYQGKVGDDISLEDAQDAARLCGLNLISQVKNACDGDLDRVKRVLKLGGFVNGAPDFVSQPQVLNGASDLMVEVFGDAGRHARSAVGVTSLPLGVAVEIDGIFEIET
ncbi:MAG: RidA family protein [Xanthomonadales bacterium]|nr:RidA family protein [Xanthomonadales bacterium]